MTDKKQGITAPFESGAIFDRVVFILEQARGNVVRAVNSNMVWAYWLIGREIVEELQGGEERAEYGQMVLGELSRRLTERYGKGFSVPNLQNFRKFYLAYSTRVDIQYPPGTKSLQGQIQYPVGTKLSETEKLQTTGKELQKDHSVGDESLQGFSPQLSWSHYRVLMRVESPKARDFYEREAAEGGWDKRTLERQIHTQYYERCLHSQQPEQMIAEGRQLQKSASPAADTLKNPYVLE